MSEAQKVTIKHNKDHSITLFCRGKKVERFTGVFANQDVHNFLTGWFGTDDRKSWKIKHA